MNYNDFRLLEINFWCSEYKGSDTIIISLLDSIYDVKNNHIIKRFKCLNKIKKTTDVISACHH